MSTSEGGYVGYVLSLRRRFLFCHLGPAESWRIMNHTEGLKDYRSGSRREAVAGSLEWDGQLEWDGAAVTRSMSNDQKYEQGPLERLRSRREAPEYEQGPLEELRSRMEALEYEQGSLEQLRSQGQGKHRSMSKDHWKPLEQLRSGREALEYEQGALEQIRSRGSIRV